MDESIFVSDAATTSSVIMNQQVSVDDQMDSNSSTMEESLSLDDSVHVGIIRNHTDALQMNRIVEAIDLPPSIHPVSDLSTGYVCGGQVKVLHRQNQYLNNRMEQDHRHIKQRYYPMLGSAKFESASRFCTAFDELRNYLRIRSTGGEHVPADIRRENFTNKWSTLMTELLA